MCDRSALLDARHTLGSLCTADPSRRGLMLEGSYGGFKRYVFARLVSRTG
jgi:hypothetical protein